jgi:hypothetical protein
MFIATIFIFSVVTKFHHTFRDSPNRFLMIENIDHKLLHGVLTTRERANALQELLDELEKHVRPGDYLLAYNHIGLVHYLTETVPWLGHPWPDLYEPERTQREIATRSGLPVVVRANYRTTTPFWPNKKFPSRSTRRHKMNRQVIGEFLTNHNYKLVWSNHFFDILKPSSFS